MAMPFCAKAVIKIVKEKAQQANNPDNF